MNFFGRQRRFVAYMLLATVTTCSTPSAATEKRLPLVISTWDFREANEAAWRSLRARPNDPLDALVTGCTTCERLQCDGSVGFGGSPDERGKTTLDAMIMDGATMNMGAVAGMHDVKNAIGVARMVLEHTRHSLLVGEAATEFAEAMGFPRESLTTDESEKMWRDWQKRQCQPNFWVNVNPDPRLSCGPYEPLQLSGFGDGDALQRSAYAFGPFNHDTIGMIVIDESGHIYAGTSTNGATHKIPGRVGDSPIPGAGAYADNEVGAAVATGDGDVMMRFLPSLIAVESMRRGLSPAVASEGAMKRMLKYYPDFSGGLVVADTKGNYAASCAGMDKFPFAISSGDGSDGTRVEYKVCDLSANKKGTK